MRARRALLDTGPVVALVNAADPDHERCREVWARFRGRVYTVEGVLVEATHLLRRAPAGARSAVGLVIAADATIVAPSHDRLRRAVELMSKYGDVPMDLVDALLVVAAEEEGIDEILTLDRRGFNVYRIAGRTPFRVLP